MDNLKTESCESFIAKELQDKSHFLYTFADPSLLQVYSEAKDNRRQIYDSSESMEADFQRLNSHVENREELHTILRDGLCHRVVMWFIHHLPTSKQTELAQTGFILPLLPMTTHTNLETSTTQFLEQDPSAKEVHKAYDASITCQKCHVGGIDDLQVPEVKPTTQHQLSRRCYTNYKELFGIECKPCDGIAGKYWGDDDDKFFTADPCTVVGTPEQIPVHERVPAAFPDQFSVELVAGCDRWGRTTNPAGKGPFPPLIDSMYGQVTGHWFADITHDSDVWLLRHDTKYEHVAFNGTKMPLLSFDVSEIHSQTRSQQAMNNTGQMVSLIHGIPSFIPGGCTCVADPVGVPDVHHVRTEGLDEMEYLGRINITLSEFDNSTVTVDHWANWFFHVFMELDTSLAHYGKAPKRLASAYAGTAVYDNWKLQDPKIDDPEVWNRGIPTSPERVGPNKGKYCLNPQKIDMCDNISVDTFPPKNDDAAKGDSKKINWKTIHRNFMPNYEKLSTEFSRRLNTQ